MAGDAVATEPSTAAAPDQTPGYRRQGTFHSLQYRDYRLVWLGQCGAAASQWMEQIARPLLILHLTDSAILVGLVAAARMLPMLFVGLWAGVLADRMDKRRILIGVQATTFATHLVTGVLIVAGMIEPWMVFLGTFVGGSAMAFNQPTRQSLIPRVVPPEALSNAVALNSMAVNVMRTTGPSIAGLILAVFDFGELYFLQAGLYVWVIIWTLQLSAQSTARGGGRPKTSMLADFKEGFTVVRDDRLVLYLLGLSLVMFVWGMPYQSVFVPLIATKVLDVGSSGAGLMISVVGIGGLIGSLAVATFGNSMRRRGLVLLTLIGVYAVGLIFLSRAELLVLAVPALLITGSMQTAYMTIMQAFALERTPRELQGRVMSLFSLDRGLIPLGATLAGVFAATLGPQDGLALMAVICLGSLILAIVLLPALRKI
jgi:predicted MFS family arabinose efflux permease